ncbi:MAG TPA: S-methyl-5-thioribose kinase [Candidatus Latescibacteria bacterium]|jgi:5-methylthioribose kinase|nr:S-methyl-5-thioribose kinase [Gemmatimonadaceae bacterium]MDP6014629.1 S-methyl-5-thioribose kinase [Candidatus Latescibacterota bacterium]HJP30125.1 S-methyl-5-thioribose kinase [Candidatus Latescibacterota bacterium]|tara:strand:- start:300 stop:1400 length:1101 start_codon:yes stop_codon:yes gene_type:complete
MNWTCSVACDYVAETGLLGEGPLRAEEVGDGNLNFVFRVWRHHDPERSLIVKQAPPYIKVLGPEYCLTQHRVTIEARAMVIYDRLAPGSVPRPLHFDADAHVLLMEDLRGYRILRHALIAGQIEPKVAASVGAFMATMHRATLAETVSPEERERYQQDFHNPDMQGITSDYVFTKPFRQDPTNRHTEGLDRIVDDVRADSELLAEIRRLRGRFNEAREGLVHGDLHTGSVMVNGQGARVIDAEFAFYGPIAFDVGALVANYLLAWYAHAGHDRMALMQCIEDCWRAYREKFKRPSRLPAIWREALQFAGVKMLRRILGAAHVEDIESIEDDARRCAVETQAIACGRVLIADPPSTESLPQTVREFA